MRVTRRQLLLLCASFFALRLLLVLCAADRLSEPDAAEAKLMRIGDEWISTGRAPSFSQLLWHARAGTNAPHGAFLLVSLLYAALAVPFGAAGSYLALKLVAVGFSVVALAAWTATAGRLGGPLAAAGTALLFLLSPSPFLAGSMVPWGSHPEAAAMLGLCAWALARWDGGRGAMGAGALLGLAAGCDLLAAPLAAALGVGRAWDVWRAADEDGKPSALPLASMGAGAAATLGGMLWLTGGASASVVETPGSSPLELLAEPAGAGLGPALLELLPLRVWAGALPRAAPSLVAGLDLAWSIALLAALALAAWGLARRRREWGLGGALLVVGPVLHMVVLAALAPRRPSVPPRYLLPLWPLLLLAPGLALGWSRGRATRAAACAALLLWLVPGLAVQGRLLRPARIPGFALYRPAAWLAADIGHVGYDLAPLVGSFMEAREGVGTDGFGFAAGAGAADDPLGPRSDPLDPAALLVRRDAWLAAHPGASAEERILLHENAGWGLAVFAWGHPGVWHSLLSRLPEGDRRAMARGLGRGLADRGKEGCRAIARYGGPDREAMEAGAGGCLGR